MKTIAISTALLIAFSGPVLAGLHVQVPDAANEVTAGTGGEGATANAANAGLADPANNNSGGANATGAENASQKGSGRK